VGATVSRPWCGIKFDRHIGLGRLARHRAFAPQGRTQAVHIGQHLGHGVEQRRRHLLVDLGVGVQARASMGDCSTGTWCSLAMSRMRMAIRSAPLAMTCGAAMVLSSYFRATA
jgi:hypothetical protein